VTRFRVLVADDEPLALGMVAALLRSDPEIESVHECADARAARELIAEQRPDIVFLDIEMPEMTGLDIAADLTADGPVIVFVTAFSRYATDAFQANASEYVLKPFSDQRFFEALQRAKRRARERRMGDLATQLATLSSELQPPRTASSNEERQPYLKRLAFKHEDRTIVLKTTEIVWIEAEDYYVRIHSTRGRHLVRASLASLETRLDPAAFIRAHRAAIVNVEEVREVQDKGALSLLLSDGAEVPVSRARKSQVEAALIPRLAHARRFRVQAPRPDRN
jgi:two-component system LytT family response regulator